MGYALQVGVRYLRSKKRSTISVITVIAVGGVALGVGALLSVMAITGGFQDAFRTKILGVNAHVLVLKYGLDFSEYREVVEHSAAMPQVAGAAPFVIHEMMMAKGDRLSGVLVKGIDPEQTPTVLDLPKQMVRGNLQGLRLADARPANPKPPPPRWGLGAMSMFMRLPSMRGMVWIVAMSASSLHTRSSTALPVSGWIISRPRN